MQQCPYMILSPCTQSHPFEERCINVSRCEDEALKIGRAVARWKPGSDNAIFDCKVLSRNHAGLWYEDGCFLLRDTKSSNGTFVNNERLSKSGEESPPRQIFSGDILQFGVDIVENANKVTHGCIVAMVRLYDEKGEETYAPETVMPLSVKDYNPNLLNCSSLISSYQLFQLQQYMKEANHREKQLIHKIRSLQETLFTTEQASVCSWQALINEERLLSRIEVLESQLAICSKNIQQDTFEDKLMELVADRTKLESTMKESLRRAEEEKSEAFQRLADVERSLINTEEECLELRNRNLVLNEQMNAVIDKNACLLEELSQVKQMLLLKESNNDKFPPLSYQDEVKMTDVVEKPEEVFLNFFNEDIGAICPEVRSTSEGSINESEKDKLNQIAEMYEQITFLKKENERLQDDVSIKVLEDENAKLRAKLGSVESENERIKEMLPSVVQSEGSELESRVKSLINDSERLKGELVRVRALVDNVSLEKTISDIVSLELVPSEAQFVLESTSHCKPIEDNVVLLIFALPFFGLFFAVFNTVCRFLPKTWKIE